MEMHLIREAVKETLSGKTDAGNRVFNSEIFPIADTQLPAINIFTPSDIPDGPTLLTTLQVAIYLGADEGDSLGEALDTLTKTVMAELKDLFEDTGLSVAYTGRDTQYNGEAAQAYAVQTLSYQITTFYEA